MITVQRANVANIWANFQSVVATGQATTEAMAALAHTIVETLMSKDTGAQSWGIRLLKYGWTNKGL
jgi:hypothetical protein